MAKTLVIAEKPSVGRDLARVLPDKFKKEEGYLEGESYVISWAVGHLVQLAEPDTYDKKFKSWKMDHLPIVPKKFKLTVRDERARKQLKIVTGQIKREDISEIINACDAGREGELIFAYLYQQSKSELPVKRLWLSSMTDKAIKEAFTRLRPSDELASLESAARSRSEADWIVGMNSTRAATIRLRSQFDGAVSLGRVQTPTLALIARREQEIRDFKPEPYWLIDAGFTADKSRKYQGRFHSGANPRIKTEQEAAEIVAACTGQQGTITKLVKSTRRDKPPLLYDLTTLQREANSRFGFSAQRTLSSAQRLYEEHKVLTYPRTNSRYLSSDMVEEITPTVQEVRRSSIYKKAADYVLGLSSLPLERIINDEKVTDHHAIIPTRSEHDLSKIRDDDLKIYDLAVRRFLAVFHPEAVFDQTRVETEVKGYIFRTRGKILVEAGWRGVYGEIPEGETKADNDEVRDQNLPQLEKDEEVSVAEVYSLAKETKPPRRFSDASLLAAMETAGKLVDEEEAREAMKDSGIGTPATRAQIIERLIQVGYIEREGRALVASEKGLNVIRLLEGHPLTQPGLTGEWERRLLKIEQGQDTRAAFMSDIAKFAQETVSELDKKLEGVRIPRANLGPCPVCGNDIIENRKGFSCWSKDDPGCGFVIWKGKASKLLPASVAKELIRTGRTAKQVPGFKGKKGRFFKAKLKLYQNEEGRWRVDFDEPWAQEGVRLPEVPDEAELEAAKAAQEAKQATA